MSWNTVWSIAMGACMSCVQIASAGFALAVPPPLSTHEVAHISRILVLSPAQQEFLAREFTAFQDRDKQIRSAGWNVLKPLAEPAVDPRSPEIAPAFEQFVIAQRELITQIGASEAKLTASLAPVLSEYQLARLPQIEQWLARRRCNAPDWDLDVAKVDPEQILIEVLRPSESGPQLDEASFALLQPILAVHGQEITALYEKVNSDCVNRAVEGTHILMRADETPMAERQQKLIALWGNSLAAQQRVAEISRRSAFRIRDALPVHFADVFWKTYQMRTHPMVYPDHTDPSDVLAYIRENQILDAQLAQSLIALLGGPHAGCNRHFPANGARRVGMGYAPGKDSLDGWRR